MATEGGSGIASGWTIVEQSSSTNSLIELDLLRADRNVLGLDINLLVELGNSRMPWSADGAEFGRALGELALYREAFRGRLGAWLPVHPLSLAVH